MSDRDDVLRLHDDLGVSYAATARVLGISRQRARLLRLGLGAENGEGAADPDPKSVLTVRLRNKLRALGMTPEQAIEARIWDTQRGVGDRARKLLIRHYG